MATTVPDDPATIVDSEGYRRNTACANQGGEHLLVKHKAMQPLAIVVSPDDLATIVDAKRSSRSDAWERHIEGAEYTLVKEEAMPLATISINEGVYIPDDLAPIVDPGAMGLNKSAWQMESRRN